MDRWLLFLIVCLSLRLMGNPWVFVRHFERWRPFWMPDGGRPRGGTAQRLLWWSQRRLRSVITTSLSQSGSALKKMCLLGKWSKERCIVSHISSTKVPVIPRVIISLYFWKERWLITTSAYNLTNLNPIRSNVVLCFTKWPIAAEIMVGPYLLKWLDECLK